MNSFRYRMVTAVIIIVFFGGIGLLGSVLFSNRSYAQEAYNRASLIRLHILANSDSITDQTVKMKVRDRIIKVSEPLLLRVEDPRRAAEIMKANLPLFEEEARAELIRQGHPMAVHASLGWFHFPERVYPFGTLPEGEYQGLRIVLGKGLGHNWWCVLYPPLCLLNMHPPRHKQHKPQHKQVKVEYRLAAFENMVKEKGLTMDRFWRGWGKYFGLF